MRTLEVDLTLQGGAEIPLAIPANAVSFTARGDIRMTVTSKDRSYFVEFALNASDALVRHKLFDRAMKLTLYNPHSESRDVRLSWELQLPSEPPS